MKLIVEGNGSFRFIYDDALMELTGDLGDFTVKRASHVEPVDGADRTVWYADMAPVNGPILGPFYTRAEALEAERSWLVANEVPMPV